MFSCHYQVWNPKQTAGDKPEEGGDDVKSACPLRPGRHTCYNGRNREPRPREGKLTSETRSQFGLQAATRLHEAGIASNRRSAPGPERAVTLERQAFTSNLPRRLRALYAQ